jgi:thiosulfate/3-mercaptopyruvate sulfurtransferase
MVNPLISVEELAGQLADHDLRIVDTRWYLADPTEGRAEYGRHHIPGATFLDLDGDLCAPEGPGRHPLPEAHEFARLLGSRGIGNHHRVVVYDDSAGSVAARLWWMLRHLGQARVQVLDGGYSAWWRAGLPTTAEVPSRPSEVFVAQERTDDMITRQELADRLGSVVLLDARALERYAGHEDPIDPVAGHIPTAISAPYAENTAPDGRFRPPRELRTRLGALGLGGDRPVITYCGSGVTACSNVLAAVVAGLPAPLLYPGSWSDWCTTPGMPIAVGPEPGEVESGKWEVGSES